MPWRLVLRYTIAKPTIILAGIILALIIVHQTLLPHLPLIIPATHPYIYGIGSYGLYPTQDFASFPLPGPRASTWQWDQRCDEGLVLMTPNGEAVASPGPMVLASNGDLVWTTDEFGITANLRMQHYNGENYLTFWAGEKAATSGKGMYYMLDSSYHVVRTISAAGQDLHGDLHEFEITDDGTALLTIYNTTTADLKGMGIGRGAHGWIVDNLFQEIDMKTGELLFQWRSSDHFNPVDTYMHNPFGGYSFSNPFDYYHLNSVEKDSQGNYLISSRHFHSITCISPTGETLWVLGGRDNQFRDLSDGDATNFKWQHDARWVFEADGIISLFDNQRAGPLHISGWQSRAMIVQLDVANRTATLLHDYYSPTGILASSQGSVQVNPGSRNVFVGWGSAAAFSEFAQDGTLLCETHLTASWFFSWERMKSYRTTKAFGWHGVPQTPPSVAIEDGVLFVSWNGATEVAFWALEASTAEFVDDHHKADDFHESSVDTAASPRTRRSSEAQFETIDIIPKVGFEGFFELLERPSSGKRYTCYRVGALDANHEVLAYSHPVKLEEPPIRRHSFLGLLWKFLLVVAVFVGARTAINYWRSSAAAVRKWKYAKIKSFL